MADETVWIDLDEVEAAAKKIMNLLDELNGPANQLEAKIKQVQESVYGTDLLGKALMGGSSSVGGLAQHQEQVLAGIRTLIQNATAVGENLQTMAARHRANDEAHATELGRITDTGAMPADPALASLPAGTVGTVQASLPNAPLGQVGTVQATLPDAPLRPMETVHASMPTARIAPDTGTDPTPPPPPSVAPIGDTHVEGGYHDPDAPTLDYNHADELLENLSYGGPMI
ncbi:WXG100 family type VII secretion target [Streptomyces sp. TLI_171]|uniref:WXG100 family type VII secretion target n=1 Tax=Streptomyces sp. TLI_171 TaxID=1938859 RepID=UPI000C1A0D88|nr:hypothetical protein [Streptomyces sp. TLI_171]RKE22227.1 hypothetical protein BX266_5666 [Streptomyces sp. TLI_171]